MLFNTDYGSSEPLKTLVMFMLFRAIRQMGQWQNPKPTSISIDEANGIVRHFVRMKVNSEFRLKCNFSCKSLSNFTTLLVLFCLIFSGNIHSAFNVDVSNIKVRAESLNVSKAIRPGVTK